MTDLSSAILGIVAQATPQAPMAWTDLIEALLIKHPDTTPDEPHDALETLTGQRMLSTARITRDGITQDVYWPTGLKTPALAGIKPKETTVPSNQTESLSSRLIKAIVAHGPLLADDLAQKSGVGKNNIGGNMQHAIKTGSITTRKAYVPERGREMTHYMTTTQAQEWDARGEQIEVTAAQDPSDEPHAGHVMNHPDAAPISADEFSLMAVLADIRAAIGDTGQIMLGELAQAIKTRINDLKNDVAARDLILNNLADTLKVGQIADIPAALDDLTHALGTRAMTTRAPAGKPALLLIDSADLTEVEMLGDDDDAQAMAMSSIELGHAARVMVVRIVGEATRRVEWKEAA